MPGRLIPGMPGMPPGKPGNGLIIIIGGRVVGIGIVGGKKIGGCCGRRGP